MNREAKTSKAYWIFIVFTVLCLAAVAFGIVGLYRVVRDASISIPATASANRTGTALAYAATTETHEHRVSITEEARKNYATKDAQAAIAATATARSTWTEVFFDPFDSFDVGNWLSGESTDSYATINFSLENGKYHLDVAAYEDTHWRVLSDVEVGSKFDIKVEVQKLSGLTSNAYGIVFREKNGDFFTFLINDIPQYWVSLKRNGRWYSVIPPYRTDVVKPREVNTLQVVAEGNDFHFYINEQLVGDATDDSLSSGKVGIAVELLATHEAVFEFDNFIIMAPP